MDMERLSRLFYDFRLAQLNCKYYSRRLSFLKRIDHSLSIIVIVATAASFGVLAFDGAIPHPKVIAATLSVLAFLISVAMPIFGLGAKIENVSSRACAFHYAAQQLEGAIKFIKTTESTNGEVLGWSNAAKAAYMQASALPDTDAEDRRLVKKVEDEINCAYPANYVWTAM